MKSRELPTLVADGSNVAGSRELIEASEGLRSPVYLPGMCARSDAAEQWTLEHLLSLEPETPVTAEYYADADRRQPYVHVVKPFREIAAAMAEEPEKWFIAELNFDEVFARAAADLPRVAVLPPDARKLLRLVFFGNDTQSATHFHVRDQAILEHLKGKKKVVLAGPKTTAALATNSAFGGRPQFSTHGPEPGQGALDCFSELVGDEAILVEMHPGDALFIPVHWWHWVEGEGECLSVTTFWRAAYREWAFPAPGLRAATAVTLGEAAKLVRRFTQRSG